MKPHGTYKLRYRTTIADPSYLDPMGFGLGRSERIIESIRNQISAGGPEQSLRIRRIFSFPYEIFRVEIEEPELSYQRTTLLDRDSLDDLLETLDLSESVFESD